MTSTSLVWLRNDLRIADNPALSAAVRAGDVVIALYIHETTKGVRAPGAAARWWLHHSLVDLGAALAERGIALVVESGNALKLVPELVARHKAGAVFWNRRYAPCQREADAAIKASLKQDGVSVESFAANVLVEPWDIKTGQGKPYSVFTPFWKTLRDMPIPQPLRRPDAGGPIKAMPVDSDYREPHWSPKMAPYWAIGETAAQLALVDFLDERLDGYKDGRDVPAKEATSRLSPHLRAGEISPRQIWYAAQAIAHGDHTKQEAVDKFLSEVAWRDFSYHQLYHRADIASVPMQPKYAGMPWRGAEDDLIAWQQGQTGLPIVDAGMRELWETGYMQNRVRMLVASLLAKNLLVDWRLGEAWFWDCLVDGDVASNPASWQWVAGCGLDAAPYFRIFNPVTQGERFDASGDYVRRWVPEIAALPDKWVQQPADAPADVLRKAGVVIGKTYPAPIVDLKTSRVRALEASKHL
ncbi:deoxyribodipyrimidine photo-lyase [Devosia sp. 2618]|uniref:cryptochrome/photolyase family protein n=1 Tax=Devosia sp. 2618 TaxID=3156454 RepID=UPI003394F2D9